MDIKYTQYEAEVAKLAQVYDNEKALEDIQARYFEAVEEATAKAVEILKDY